MLITWRKFLLADRWGADNQGVGVGVVVLITGRKSLLADRWGADNQGVGVGVLITGRKFLLADRWGAVSTLFYISLTFIMNINKVSNY